MSNIEEKLWDYIDGNCSAEEQQAIKALIESDEIYSNKYQQLLAINADFEELELEEPPMAFTFRVMEAVRAEEALVPLKASINKNIIRGITGIFVLIISSILIYALFSVNWSEGHAAQSVIDLKLPSVKVPEVKPSLSGVFIKGFVFFDVVVGLFIFDYFLRKPRSINQ